MRRLCVSAVELSEVDKRLTCAMVGPVRRSARLLAAVASENAARSNPVPQKLVGAISVPKRSSRVSRTKSQILAKAENEGPEESTAMAVDAESVSDAQPKQIKALRRAKSLKKFPSRDLEVCSNVRQC
jgi:hypothetical protein